MFRFRIVNVFIYQLFRREAIKRVDRRFKINKLYFYLFLIFSNALKLFKYKNIIRR